MTRGIMAKMRETRAICTRQWLQSMLHTL